MKGTMVYDIVTMVGMVILVFTLIYWSTTVGASIVADYVLSAPKTIQDSVSSYVIMSCVESGDMTTTLKITPIQFTLKMNSTHFSIEPTGEKYSTWKEVERGGSIRLRKAPASALIACTGTTIKPASIAFDPNSDDSIIIKKQGNEVSAGVR